MNVAIVVNNRTKTEGVSQRPFDHEVPPKRFTKIIEIDNILEFTLVSIIGKVHIRSEKSEVIFQKKSLK